MNNDLKSDLFCEFYSFIQSNFDNEKQAFEFLEKFLSGLRIVEESKEESISPKSPAK